MQGTAEKFIDTNVLVHAFDSSEPKKKAVAEGILKECFKGKEGTKTLNPKFSSSFFSQGNQFSSGFPKAP
jgi:predicted nucleic acid-binding protein